MIKLDNIEIEGFEIHSEEFMNDLDKFTNKIRRLLMNYKHHVAFHEGIDFLGQGYESDYLSKEDMEFIENL